MIIEDIKKKKIYIASSPMNRRRGQGIREPVREPAEEGEKEEAEAKKSAWQAARWY